MSKWAWALAALALLAAGVAAAQPGVVGAPDSRVERYRVEYRLQKDGAASRTVEKASAVLHERALPAFREAEIPYSTSMERLELLEAYTRKPDGQRLAVDLDEVPVRVDRGPGPAAAAFSDRSVATVAFPDLEVGDAVVLRYRITQPEPPVPGHFSVREEFSRAVAYDAVQVRVDAPASLEARHAARGMEESVRKDEGRRIVEWTWANPVPKASARRDYSVYDPDAEVGYVFSTFGSWKAVARAYGEEAVPRARVTGRVRELAEKIVGERKDPREQARALYDWVAREVRPAGGCLGPGARVPRELDFVLDNRVADCKDRATLLQALLAARGIDSTQALVNAGNIYRLPEVPEASVANHVLNYIPSLDLFLDASSDSTPFGLLPFAVSDKDALLVQDFQPGLRTPAAPQRENRQEMMTVAALDADGSVTADITAELKGPYAAEMREWMRAVPAERLPGFVDEALREAGIPGAGELEQDDPGPLADEHRFTVHLELEEYVAGGGEGALVLAPLWRSVAPIRAMVEAALEPVEPVPVACTSGATTEGYEIALPPGVEVISLPPDLSLSNGRLSYEAKYRLEENRVVAQRTLTDRTPGNVCPPEAMAEAQPLAREVLANLRTPVRYR